MPTSLYPYKRREFGAHIQVEFTGDVPERMSDFEYSFTNADRPASVDGKVYVTIPEDSSDYFPEAENLEEELDVVIVWDCHRSRQRELLTMTPDHSFKKWNADFSINCRSVSGALNLYAFGLRKRDAHKPEKGFASQKGTILFTSSPAFVIEIDDAIEQKGADLESRWIDFRDPTAGNITNDYATAIYHLSLDSAEPILYLNDALPNDLKRLLTHEKQKGFKANARDAFFAPIEADVWEQLATEALSIFSDNGSRFDGLDAWQVGVLQALARVLTKKMDQRSAEAEMEKWSEIEVTHVVEKVLPMALQEHVSLSTAFDKVSTGVNS